jgi:hypothetical protein
MCRLPRINVLTAALVPNSCARRGWNICQSAPRPTFKNGARMLPGTQQSMRGWIDGDYLVRQIDPYRHLKVPDLRNSINGTTIAQTGRAFWNSAIRQFNT